MIAIGAAGFMQAPKEPDGKLIGWKTWGGNRCGHCCHGDRCDDPTHYKRPDCPYCLCTGNAIWLKSSAPEGV